MDEKLRSTALDAIGFMPPDEGLALYDAALSVAGMGPLLEIGSYCGQSAVYLGAAARARASLLYSIDHHRGSEEHQVGEEYHDPRLFDPDTGRVDTFPQFRRTIAGAGLEDVVVAIVGDSVTVGSAWATPLSLVLIDGSHARTSSHDDYRLWAGHVVAGGVLAIHDVFPDPANGGRPPFEVYTNAIASGEFREIGATGSLRLLERVRNRL